MLWGVCLATVRTGGQSTVECGGESSSFFMSSNLTSCEDLRPGGLGLCWVVYFILHFNRFSRGGIPVRRFIVHGAVKDAEG